MIATTNRRRMCSSEPCKYAFVHFVFVVLLVSLTWSVESREVGPLWLLVLCWVDAIATYAIVSHIVPEIGNPAILKLQFVVAFLVFGTLQWALIGAVVSWYRRSHSRRKVAN